MGLLHRLCCLRSFERKGEKELWFVIWNFFLLRLLCISINLPYVPAWNTVIMPGLVLLVTSWIIGPSHAASLEPLAHCQNVASISLLFKYYFGRCSSELARLVSLPFSLGMSSRYSDRLHDFSVAIPICYRGYLCH